MVTERSFAFHGSKIGRAKAGFEAGGFPPIDIYPIGNGMYAIVVMLPPSIENVDWELLDSWQQRRRRRWRIPNWRRLAMIAAVLAIVIGGGYAFLGAVAPGPNNAQAAAQPGSFFGFQLPSNAPANPLTDAITKPIEDIKEAIVTALWLAGTVAALALLFVLRRPLMALGSGLAGIGRMLGKGKGQ